MVQGSRGAGKQSCKEVELRAGGSGAAEAGSGDEVAVLGLLKEGRSAWGIGRSRRDIESD